MRRCTAVLTTIVTGGLLLGAASADGQEDRLTGAWQGQVYVVRGEVEVDFLLEVEVREAGGRTGRLWFPTQGRTPQEVRFLSVEPSEITFETEDDAGVVAVFTGALSEDGQTIAGDLAEQGQRRPFQLVKAPGATLPPPQDVEALELEQLRSLFNADSERTRLILVLTPGCGLCKMGARMVDRYLLKSNGSSSLVAYVVWQKRETGDSHALAEEAAALLVDGRARHFWSEDASLGELFADVLGFEKEPAWNVFLAYRPGRQWLDTVPTPDVFMHGFRNRPSLPSEQVFNGEVWRDEVESLLAPDASSSPVEEGG